MKTFGIISIILFVLSAGIFASAYLLVKPSMTDDKTKKTCESINQNSKVGEECHIFQDGTCLKGTLLVGGLCDHKSNPTAQILMISSGILLVAAIVFLILNFTGKKKK